MSNKKKQRIIPVLDDNFHESIFFLEIQYKKTPVKEIKYKLINYYIKGVDYYTGTNHKDFSLYFQTKLLNIMKEQDHFEKTVEAKMKEENLSEKINEMLNKAKNIDTFQKNTIDDEIQKQKDQFLFNLSFKKKYKKLRKYNSFRVSVNKKEFNLSLRKDSSKVAKKSSLDLTNYVKNNKSNNNKSNNKNNNNSLFSKVDNTLVDLDKLNTLLIIEYVKRLKQFSKSQLESLDKKISEYMNYTQIDNELNLLYEGFPDKDNEDCKNIKKQIDENRDEWKLLEKENNNEYIIKENKLKETVNKNNIANLDKVLYNVFKKMNELIKENQKQ